MSLSPPAPLPPSPSDAGPGRQSASLPPRERVAAVARVRRQVARALDREQVLRPGETVVVACSGGPDSSALLDALARLSPSRRLSLLVAHVDHGLRPGSAEEAQRVAEQAASRGLAFRALTVTVSAGGSLQDRARQARHAALRDLATEVGATAIALGHSADDQVETVVMRLLSGASPRSLRAMGARDGQLARPLLRLWRHELAAYCSALQLEVVDDPSNRDPRFLRSRVRHDLIPAMEAVFPAARRRLLTLADRMRHATGAMEGAGSNSDPMLDCRQ